jgi:5-methylthioribose kinase
MEYSTNKLININQEFAFYGPMGYDIGAIIANLAIAFFSKDAHATPEEISTEKYKSWILDQIVNLWYGFEKKFSNLWRKSAKTESSILANPFFLGDGFREYERDFFLQILRDSIGFAAAKMIRSDPTVRTVAHTLRRIIGVAHVEDFECISDQVTKVKVERKALGSAKYFLTNSEKMSSIEEFVTILTKYDK